jgi:glycerol dehydrogenase
VSNIRGLPSTRGGPILDISDAYSPGEIFAPATRGDLPLPRVFVAPGRYVQGQGVIDCIGRYLSLVPSRRAALLMSERGSRNEGARIIESLRLADIEHVTSIFNGECSLEEITAHVEFLANERIDCVIAAGGGKCIDAGKAIAFRLDLPIVIVPTLASNDAPCSALSILYSPEGISTGVEFYPNSPAIVAVDTGLVAEAPERYLVAGIGDAMATWYEARVCMQNESAVTCVGTRPTLAASAIAQVCAQTLFEQGSAAAAAVATNTVNDSLEKIVEANTLLSGIGFESGGLAAAHGVAQSYTSFSQVEANFLHGEMVAMGVLAQLMMESQPDEAARVAEFFAGVGLPIHLGQLSLDETDANVLESIIDGTLDFAFIGNMPQPVTPESVRSAVSDAHSLGLSVIEKVGDAAYRRLQKD